jgi:PAS domain S-box-containing protein
MPFSVRHRSARVLLVDADPEDALRVGGLLRGVGHVPQWVTSFAAAREAVAREAADVVLAAQALDGRTGLQLLHALGGPACPTAFILLAAERDEELDVLASEAGADDFLVAGELTPTLLERSIRYALARRAAQDAMRMRAQEFRALAENAPDAIQRFDRCLRHLYANPAVERATGVPRENIVGRTGGVLGAPEHVHRMWEEALRRVFASGRAEELEFRTAAPDGRELWMHARLIPEPGLDGRVATVLAISRDVTEARVAREQLRASEEYHRALVEHASDGVAVLNADGTVRYSSTDGAGIQGARAEWQMGRHAHETVHPDDLPRLQALLAGLVAEPGGVCRAEVRVIVPGGEERTLETVSRNLLHHPAVRGIVVNFRDVTERGRAAEAVRASEARYRALVEAVPDLLLVLDREGTCLDFSAGRPELLVAGPERLVGRTLHQVLPPDAAEPLMAALREALRTGEVQTVEYRLGLDGGTSYFEARLAPDERGGVLALVRDVTGRTRAQEALRGSEEQFRTVVESLGEGLLITGRQAEIVYVNQRMAEICGYAPDEMEGRVSHELLLPPEVQPRARARLAERLAGVPGGFEAVLLRRDGSRLWAQVAGVPYRDGTGAVIGTIEVVKDVTEQRMAAEQLRASEERLRLILGQVPALIWTTDRELRFTSSAGQALAALALDPDQVRGLSLYQYFGTENPDALGIAEHRRALGGEVSRYEMEWGGRIFSSVVEPFRDAAGAVTGVLGVALDVTDRHRAGEVLRAHDRRFRSLIENASDVIAVVRADGTVGFASPSVERLLGVPRESLAGRPLVELVHPDERAHALERLRRMVQNEGTPEQSHFRVLRGDGEWRVVEVIGTSLLHDPAVAGVVLNIRDVTDRQRALQALEESQAKLLQAQKMEAVGRLAGGVAHDFNNLLTAIRGNAELLLDDLPPGSIARDDAEEIRRAADRAAGLTRQLLAFSRQQVLQPRVVDVNGIVSGVEKMLRRLIGEDVELVTELQPGLAHVTADPGQVEQVLMNLAVNARDAMPDGGRLVVRTSEAVLGEDEARRYSYVEPGDYVLLAVRDTGTGMDEQILAKVFEPFFTTKPPGQGTGLGLSTVYGIVKQSGGYVWIDSRPGEGTTIRIYLPRVEAAAADAPPEQPAGAPRTDTRKTLLLVEDEETVRRMATRALRRAGYRVLQAADGEEALAVSGAHAGPIHVLMTDVVMPRMGGRDLAVQLRRERPETRVLFISGYSEAAVAGNGVLEPGTWFLGKPFTPDLLLARLGQVLNAPAPEAAAAD